MSTVLILELRQDPGLATKFAHASKLMLAPESGSATYFEYSQHFVIAQAPRSRICRRCDRMLCDTWIGVRISSAERSDSRRWHQYQNASPHYHVQLIRISSPLTMRGAYLTPTFPKEMLREDTSCLEGSPCNATISIRKIFRETFFGHNAVQTTGTSFTVV